MSLISDALKTAQRERSGQVTQGPDGSPLLEGFFPYVSTSSAKSKTSLSRGALIGVCCIVVAGVGLWFAAPAIRGALQSAPKQPPVIALPPRQLTPAPVPTPTQTPDQQVAASAAMEASSPDSTPAQAVAEKPLAARDARPRTQTRPTVTVPQAQPSKHIEVVQQSETTPTPDRRSAASVEAPRPNFEAEAVAAYGAGDYQTARLRFEAALRTTPTASAWTNYGVTLEKLGDARAAGTAYQKAMGVDPNYLNAWLYLARLYRAAGDIQRAVPLFNRALEIEPTNSDVNADLAELEFKAGAFSEARRYADVAARSNQSNPRAHYYLALAADTLKDRDLARRGFEDFLRTIAGQERENSASVGYARVRLQELKGKP